MLDHEKGRSRVLFLWYRADNLLNKYCENRRHASSDNGRIFLLSDLVGRGCVIR